MKLEKEKREKHIEHQRENANKRWKKDECDGNATALPLENENENENINENNKEKKKELLKRKEEEFIFNVFQYEGQYSGTMLQKFCNYWTEKNKSGTKMRWELERVFEINRRLATWSSRDRDIKTTAATPKMSTKYINNGTI
jgi:hypothetical protein